MDCTALRPGAEAERLDPKIRQPPLRAVRRRETHRHCFQVQAKSLPLPTREEARSQAQGMGRAAPTRQEEELGNRRKRRRQWGSSEGSRLNRCP